MASYPPDSEVPTVPGTPEAKNERTMHINIPAPGRLTSGELRDFIAIFRYLADGIEIVEKCQEHQGQKQEFQSRQIGEIHKELGKIDSTVRGITSQLEDFKTAVLTEVRAIAKSVR
jgi:hypothetical protein